MDEAYVRPVERFTPAKKAETVIRDYYGQRFDVRGGRVCM